MCRKPNCKHGQALVNMIIAGAVLAILLNSLIAMLKTGANGKRYVAGSLDVSQLVSEILFSLERPKICKGLFRNTANSVITFNPNASEVATIARLALNDRTIAEIGRLTSDVAIESIILREVDSGLRTSKQIGSETILSYIAELEIRGSKATTGTGNYGFRKTFLIELQTRNSSHEITGCESSDGSEGLGGMNSLVEVVVGTTPLTQTRYGTVPIGEFSYTVRGSFLRVNTSAQLQVRGVNTVGMIDLQVEDQDTRTVIVPWKEVYFLWGVDDIQSNMIHSTDMTMFTAENGHSLKFTYRMRVGDQASIVGDAHNSGGVIYTGFQPSHPIRTTIEDWE